MLRLKLISLCDSNNIHLKQISESTGGVKCRLRVTGQNVNSGLIPVIENEIELPNVSVNHLNCLDRTKQQCPPRPQVTVPNLFPFAVKRELPGNSFAQQSHYKERRDDQ